MITLRLPETPDAIDLPGGVRVRLGRPVDGVVSQAALSWARGHMAGIETIDPHLRLAEDVVAVAAGFARYTGAGWSGVLDPATGEAAAFTDDNLLAYFRAVPGAAKLFAAKVIEPLDALESEGNGSGPAAAGISAAGPVTASPAGT